MGRVQQTLGTDKKQSDTRRRKPRGRDNKSLDKRLKMVEQEVMAKEMKFADTAVNRTAPLIVNSATSLVIDLTKIPNGTGDEQRIGDSVNVRSLFIKLFFDHNGAGSSEPQICRMILCKSKRPDGSDPQLNDILQTTAAGLAVFSAYDKARIGGFKIIKDEMFSLTNGTCCETSSFEYYWENKRIEETTFVGSAGTETERILNHYFILLISDQAANGPQVSGYMRSNYTDA